MAATEAPPTTTTTEAPTWLLRPRDSDAEEPSAQPGGAVAQAAPSH